MLESVLGTNQYQAMRISFLLKETMGAFDWDRTHNWQASTNYESDALPMRHTTYRLDTDEDFWTAVLS